MKLTERGSSMKKNALKKIEGRRHKAEAEVLKAKEKLARLVAIEDGWIQDAVSDRALKDAPKLGAEELSARVIGMIRWHGIECSKLGRETTTSASVAARVYLDELRKRAARR